MPHDIEALDEKHNRISITLFESHLAKFILEHPEIYEAAYLKLFEALKAPCATNERLQYSVFSMLQIQYPEYHAFESFDEAFYLPAADYLLKLIGDYLFPAQSSSSPQSFLHTPSISSRSPTNPFRNQLLFDEENRGVSEVEPDEITLTKAIGIVSDAHRTSDLDNYFEQAIEASGQYYQPKESAYVATWLRHHFLPIISGASGSTEALISRLLPRAPDLTTEEKWLIVFTQACNMVANGHHSLFEAILVADDLGLIPLSEADTQQTLYLQAIPPVIQENETFIRFMNADFIQSLLPDSRPIEDSLLSVSNHK